MLVVLVAWFIRNFEPVRSPAPKPTSVSQFLVAAPSAAPSGDPWAMKHALRPSSNLAAGTCWRHTERGARPKACATASIWDAGPLGSAGGWSRLPIRSGPRYVRQRSSVRGRLLRGRCSNASPRASRRRRHRPSTIRSRWQV